MNNPTIRQFTTALKTADTLMRDILLSMYNGTYAQRLNYYQSQLHTVINQHHPLICEGCREKESQSEPQKIDSTNVVELHGSRAMIQFISSCIAMDDAVSPGLRYSNSVHGPDLASVSIEHEAIQFAVLKVMTHGPLFGPPQLLRNASIFMRALMGKSTKPTEPK